MAPDVLPLRRRSIFTPTTRRVRVENFENYWGYTRGHDGKAFDYSSIPPEIFRRSWVPSYCQA